MHVRPGTTPHVNALRDIDKHHERRKLWNHGFTSAAIKDYQPTVANRVLQLVEELGSGSRNEGDINGRSVDLSRWIGYFAYDFMGDLVFGGGFELMHRSGNNDFRPILEDTMKLVGILEHISWIKGVLVKTRSEPAAFATYREYGTKRYDVRKEQGASRRDLFQFITNEERVENMDVSREQGLNDVFSAMVAGADTTSTVLSGLFFFILSNPAIYMTLQQEVDSVPAMRRRAVRLGKARCYALLKCCHVSLREGVLQRLLSLSGRNEALRLQPSLPTSLQRSPVENGGGKWVAGRFVPENTAIYIPPYVLHRDPRYFSPFPNDFIPERWLDCMQNDNTKDKSKVKFTSNTSAYIPFSYGPANCIGKNLAMLEMRMVVATLVQKFDMKLAESYDLRNWEDNLQDYFIFKVGELPVVLNLRSQQCRNLVKYNVPSTWCLLVTLINMIESLTSLLTHLPALDRRDALLFDVFCALIVHKIYNKFEVDPGNFIPTIILLVGIPVLPTYFLLPHLGSTLLTILVSYSCFYVSLISSIVLYRISPFHPLAKYPGPLSLKISKFVMMYHASRGKQYLYFKKLHDEYGYFVRVGPNELSFADAEAILPVLGPDGMRRGPLWVMHVKPGTPPDLVALRDVGEHHERRKLWNHGFTSAAIKDYQPAIASRLLQFVEELRKGGGDDTGIHKKSFDLAQWIGYFAFDFMGDLVFGGGFELMHHRDKDGLRSMLEDAMKVLGILEHIPWITKALSMLGSEPAQFVTYRNYGTKRYDMRKEQGANRRDLFHFITNEEGIEKMDVPRDQGLNEVFTAIVAGADTTSTVLGGVFFYILSNPAVFSKLQREVDSEFPLGEGEPFDAVKLSAMPYLNAVINEALRLQPPLATSLQRCPLENSGGKWVAGRFILESTAIYIPPYVLHRDPRYFSPFPDDFIPERWLDNTHSNDTNNKGNVKFTTNTSAYIPFSYGPANCVGKNLALLEMRMVVATLIQKFDMKLAEDYDPHMWEEDLQDNFIFKVGKLPVVLNTRE
ncbi:cytochrome P450 [Fomitiporia mediterranea MF3/22]|uniref:cytochrome P450 n=1 Tax=Fomitiporia mediterranea (strain MF3/22) TaxID=694068 RepID=UPI0004409316|nr:cytochrome P450 [Fomitiporia mediterranea MF3/22]EJD02376.1 cytochrome P450 [Fomitiporia mediterranea MF3/22]